MNQFIQRIASYISNEIIIKGLANSKTFQRMALRTHNTVNEYKGDAVKTFDKTMNQTMDEIHKAATKAAYSTSAKGKMKRGIPVPPEQGFKGFIGAFIKEVKKDFR